MEAKRSESIMNLAAALAVAQGQITTAPKENVANTGTFSYKYSTLDDIWGACRKPLAENGLSVVQIPTNDETGFYLETILIHSSGEWISGLMTLPITTGRMSELQAMGSAITYARRYMLGAMVGVTTGDDDDGQAAGQQQKPEPVKTFPLPTPQIPEPVKPTPSMTPKKLLTRLNQEESVNGFYTEVADIYQSVFTEGRDWPEAEDIDAWKLLFQDAKQYAKEALIQQGEMAVATAETAAMETDLENDYPEIFEEN